MDKENKKLEWSKEAILEMIQLWQTYECLYNPKNKFYHNKHARYSAFSEIADKLKVFNELVGPSDVKNKMVYLRGQYTRELSKSKELKSGSGTDETYVSNAYWFEELSFLQDFVKVRKGTCNLVEENSSPLDDSFELSQIIECDPSSVPNKRPKLEKQIKKEDAVLEAAVNVLQSLTNNNNAFVNDKNEAFCNFIKTEIEVITNESIRDECVEKITLVLLDAKKKQRLLDNSDEYQYLIE
ncbi:uncharacterized protein [Musca autumnalis]|uniref:uncharacterized protein n=1 Tax=Musca autumnalis TaxID=221902 RepID=UPI003CE77535